MQPTVIYSWSAIILWLGLYQCLLMAVYLLLRKAGKPLSNRLLAAFVLMMGFRLYTAIGEFSGSHEYLARSTELSGILTFLYGPFFYFYLKSFIERQFQLERKHLLHLLPVGLMFCGWLVSLPFRPRLPIRQMIIEQTAPPLPFKVFAIMLGLVFLGYLIMGIRTTIRFRRYAESHASFSNETYVRWLFFLTPVILLPVLSSVFTAVIVAPRAFVPYPTFGISLMASILLGIALFRPEILNGLPDAIMVDQEEDLEPKRYESSSLTEEQKSLYLSQLLAQMEQDRPYLNQELTLKELAGQVGINPKYLSQIINEKREQNFMDFINSYRIEQAKFLLTSPAHQYFTILAIGQESGFRSKSAFYNAFKKMTGMTPSAFKRGE